MERKYSIEYIFENVTFLMFENIINTNYLDFLNKLNLMYSKLQKLANYFCEYLCKKNINMIFFKWKFVAHGSVRKQLRSEIEYSNLIYKWCRP